MTRPRKQLVCIEDTPYYHVTSRCVRRSFLCGYDHHSGQDFEHRCQWIEHRIRILSSIFAINICAYAVMSNYYHIVLKLHPEQTKAWDDREVANRWLQLFQGPLLVQLYHQHAELDKTQMNTIKATTNVWRHRLADLGWFMKCLNEPIARQASKEDHCSGHFWEARYKSQCLKSENALLACMAYVDLNPVRAKMATTPEGSDYTSIKERIRPTFDVNKAIASQLKDNSLICFNTPLKTLTPFVTSINQHTKDSIPCSWPDYLQLVDWTGRAERANKRGVIAQDTPPILERLNIQPKHWLSHAMAFEQHHAKVFNREQTTQAIRSG